MAEGLCLTTDLSCSLWRDVIIGAIFPKVSCYDATDQQVLSHNSQIFAIDQRLLNHNSHIYQPPSLISSILVIKNIDSHYYWSKISIRNIIIDCFHLSRCSISLCEIEINEVSNHCDWKKSPKVSCYDTIDILLLYHNSQYALLLFITILRWLVEQENYLCIGAS